MPPSSGGGRAPRSYAAQLAVLLAAFAIPTLIARALGAGWGTAATFGQIAFLVALVALMLGSGRLPRLPSSR